MNMEEARKELLDIAGPEYCSLSLKVSQARGKTLQQECSVYLAGLNHFDGRTWPEALKKLTAARAEMVVITKKLAHEEDLSILPEQQSDD